MRSDGSLLGLDQRLGGDLDQLAALVVVVLFLVLVALVGVFLLDDVDAHLGEHRERVFDLLGGDFLRRHHGIELLIGDVAALLGALDHLLDGGIGEVEQRQRRVGPAVAVLLGGLFFSVAGFGLGGFDLGGSFGDRGFTQHHLFGLSFYDGERLLGDFGDELGDRLAHGWLGRLFGRNFGGRGLSCRFCSGFWRHDLAGGRFCGGLAASRVPLRGPFWPTCSPSLFVSLHRPHPLRMRPLGSESDPLPYVH